MFLKMHAALHPKYPSFLKYSFNIKLLEVDFENTLMQNLILYLFVCLCVCFFKIILGQAFLQSLKR